MLVPDAVFTSPMPFFEPPWFITFVLYFSFLDFRLHSLHWYLYLSKLSIGSFILQTVHVLNNISVNFTTSYFIRLNTEVKRKRLRSESPSRTFQFLFHFPMF